MAPPALMAWQGLGSLGQQLQILVFLLLDQGSVSWLFWWWASRRGGGSQGLLVLQPALRAALWNRYGIAMAKPT